MERRHIHLMSETAPDGFQHDVRVICDEAACWAAGAQRDLEAAGSTRTTARGLRPQADLSQHLPEGLLSRLDTGYGLTHRTPQPEQLVSINSLTMTGRLSGERLA